LQGRQLTGEFVGGYNLVIIWLFSKIYGIILPIDQYFSRWLKPPTSNEFVGGYNDHEVTG